MQANEVRQCAACSQPAAVCIRDWQHTRWGMQSGSSTRDSCCQACGHRFTLVPKLYIGVWGFLAVLLSLAVVPFFLFGGWALYRAWPWFRNPEVPGAPMPVIRFRAVEPLRTCAACGGAAACRNVTRRSVNLIPTGTEYRYACTRCNKEFSLSNLYGTVFDLCGAAFLLLIGALLAAALIGIPIALAGLVLMGMAFFRVIQRFRNPVMPEVV